MNMILSEIVLKYQFEIHLFITCFLKYLLLFMFRLFLKDLEPITYSNTDLQTKDFFSRMYRMYSAKPLSNWKSSDEHRE